ncbi:MAG: hypothetical protein PHD81_03470 [Candidatus Nanoarchaeia archaeon]|nr:hypothetical protein [Candidatus Nanoarchaeia archaeon]MDD5588144.1 hypothetical protein [Candidatus Nanoarchaeia archaeon]
MTNYILFAGDIDGQAFNRLIGYLTALSDKRIIKNVQEAIVVRGTILETSKSCLERDVEEYFKDEKVQEIVSKLELKDKYCLAKAEISSKKKYNKYIKKLYQKYGIPCYFYKKSTSTSKKS